MTHILIQQESAPDFSRPFPVAVRPDDAIAFRANPGVEPEGHPVTLVGFQDNAEIMTVNLFAREFQVAPESAIGKYPVFADNTGHFHVSTLAVASATTHDADAPVFASETSTP